MSHSIAGFGAIHAAGGAHSSSEHGIDENASEVILVVQVRRLGAVSREILELSLRRLHGESVGRCRNALDRATIVGRLVRGAGFSGANEFPAIGRAPPLTASRPFHAK